MFTDSNEYQKMIDELEILSVPNPILYFTNCNNGFLLYQSFDLDSDISIRIIIKANGFMYNQMKFYDLLLVENVIHFDIRIIEKMKVSNIVYSLPVDKNL